MKSSPENLKSFAARLRWVRVEIAGLTQEAFAKSVGLKSKGYFSALEKGRKHDLGQSALANIERTWGVRREWLLSGTGEPIDTRLIDRAVGDRHADPTISQTLWEDAEGGARRMTNEELWETAKVYWSMRDQIPIRARAPIRHGLSIIFNEILSRVDQPAPKPKPIEE